MSRYPSSHPLRRSLAIAAALALIPLLISATLAVQDPGGAGPAVDAVGEPAGHLVISEVLSGAGSASDEFIEIYNPMALDATLADLELVYVTASGATITRKGTWAADAPPIAPGGHLLIANDAGIFASIADQTYSGGLSAAGGSVALRVAGADTAIDAVGWGSTVSAWVEGAPALATDPGTSLERLPGGDAGGWQDTDDNATDFVGRTEPDPQSSTSPPTPPSVPTPTPLPTATVLPTPTPIPTPVPTPTATPVPTPTPTPIEVLSIEAARAAADGSLVTVIGTALTDAAFADGGGYVVDATGGIALLVSDGTYARGDLLQVTGTVGDRYAQRTIRASGADLVGLGDGSEPEPATLATGEIGEAVEGRLVATAGALTGAGTALSGGTAFNLDDGSGEIRVFVGDATGIDVDAWRSGMELRLTAVVGQRDSSGTGTAGYRLMPRDPADIAELGEPGSPTPGASPSGSPAPSDDPDHVVSTIAEARATEKNAPVTVRGVVTLPSGLTEAGSAAIADASGAIFVRISDEAGALFLGELVEIDAKRSTWTGMESLHLAVPPRRLGPGTMPEPQPRATGAIGEAEEAVLIALGGTVTTSPIRTSAGNVYFDLDDGSGPIRIFISPRSGIDASTIAAGQRVEVSGVLLQETTGQQPTRGYRLWPRTDADLRVVDAAGPAAGAGVPDGGVPGSGAPAPSPGGTAAPLVADRHEPMPLLARPRATTSPPVVVPAQATSVPGSLTGDPPTALLLLATAGGLLAAASGALVRGSLLGRLAGLVAARRPADASDEGDAASGVPWAAPPSTHEEALPELVPVSAIAAGGGQGAGAHAPSGRGNEHGRILPRT